MERGRPKIPDSFKTKSLQIYQKDRKLFDELYQRHYNELSRSNEAPINNALMVSWMIQLAEIELEKNGAKGFLRKVKNF